MIGGANVGPSYFHEEQRLDQRWTWLAVGITAFVLVFVSAQNLPLPPNVFLVFVVLPLVMLALLRARLIVDVDREEITIRFRVLWPTRRIPLSEIRRAHAVKYRPFFDYGGYGVRLGLRGWAFNVSGDEGVLVERANGSRLMIGSQRAKELEAAIVRAMRDREGS